MKPLQLTALELLYLLILGIVLGFSLKYLWDYWTNRPKPRSLRDITNEEFDSL